MRTPFNQHGGLTLVPLPGFEKFAESVAATFCTDYRRWAGKRYTKVDIAVPTIGYYGNNESSFKLPEKHIVGHDCALITSGPGTDTMLYRLGEALWQLAERDATRILVLCGYFPKSRTDKDEDDHSVLAQPRSICEMMVERSRGKVKQCVTADLHSVQSASVHHILREVSVMKRLTYKAIHSCEHCKEPICFLLPDDGAAKRYEKLLREWWFHSDDQKIVYGSKRRKDDELVFNGLNCDVKALAGAHAVIIDDEIVSGRTNIIAAGVAKKIYGAAMVSAIVPHLIGCEEFLSAIKDRDCPLDYVYCSDTIPIRKELLEFFPRSTISVVPWHEQAAEIIYKFRHSRSCGVTKRKDFLV